VQKGADLHVNGWKDGKLDYWVHEIKTEAETWIDFTNYAGCPLFEAQKR